DLRPGELDAEEQACPANILEAAVLYGSTGRVNANAVGGAVGERAVANVEAGADEVEVGNDVGPGGKRRRVVAGGWRRYGGDAEAVEGDQAGDRLVEGDLAGNAVAVAHQRHVDHLRF